MDGRGQRDARRSDRVLSSKRCLAQRCRALASSLPLTTVNTERLTAPRTYFALPPPSPPSSCTSQPNPPLQFSPPPQPARPLPTECSAPSAHLEQGNVTQDLELRSQRCMLLREVAERGGVEATQPGQAGEAGGELLLRPAEKRPPPSAESARRPTWNVPGTCPPTCHFSAGSRRCSSAVSLARACSGRELAESDVQPRRSSARSDAAWCDARTSAHSSVTQGESERQSSVMGGRGRRSSRRSDGVTEGVAAGGAKDPAVLLPPSPLLPLPPPLLLPGSLPPPPPLPPLSHFQQRQRGRGTPG